MSVKFSIDFAKLINLNYWVDPNPGPGQLLFLIISLLISFLLLIGGLEIWYLRKKYSSAAPKRNFWNGVMWTLYSLSIVSFILTFFRIEGLGGVSIRILWPIFGVVIVGTAIYFFITYQQKVPQELNKIETDNLKKKYFRTKKK